MIELVTAQGAGGLGSTFSASVPRVRGRYDSDADVRLAFSR